MNRLLTINGFDFDVSHNGIKIKGKDNADLVFSQSEVDKITSIIGIALRMQNMEALPNHIKNSPFVIRFDENDNLFLEAADRRGSVEFSWGTGDGLIRAVKESLKKSLDERKLKPGARATGEFIETGEPFV